MSQEQRPAYRPMIRDLPQAERPRERLRHYGASSLSNTELAAILLRTGLKGESVLEMATRLLARFGGLPGLARAGFEELCQQRGISEAKASHLLAALELGRRLASLQPEERPVISSPRDVSNLLMGEMAFLEQEHLRVVLLNVRNHVLGVHEVYVGSTSGAVVRAAEVFRPAVRANCSSVILVHNHPSGDPAPSAEDVEMTRQMVSAGKLLDIEVLDHIVLGQQRFISLKEKGLGFK
ncbi:MAG: DNA repair protein RadC [Chloroflexota bacterium]|nr:DNA repair protein RadC [Chloroflexota bacterium]